MYSGVTSQTHLIYINSVYEVSEKEMMRSKENNNKSHGSTTSSMNGCPQVNQDECCQSDVPLVTEFSSVS